jgi:hypothetical protein
MTAGYWPPSENWGWVRRQARGRRIRSRSVTEATAKSRNSPAAVAISACASAPSRSRTLGPKLPPILPRRPLDPYVLRFTFYDGLLITDYSQTNHERHPPLHLHRLRHLPGQSESSSFSSSSSSSISSHASRVTTNPKWRSTAASDNERRTTDC